MAFDTTTDEVIEGIRLNGKTALVTGASTGLGLETARALASAGAHVVLAVRSDEKAEKARAAILQRGPRGPPRTQPARSGIAGERAPLRRRLPLEASRAPPAHQQRRRHVHAVRAHRRRLRASV